MVMSHSVTPGDDVREDLRKMTCDLHDAIKGTPNHPMSAPTLTRLGNRRRAVEKAIREGRHVQPEVFASLLQLAPGLSCEAKAQYVQRYTAALMALEADKALQILQGALQEIGADGETVTIIDCETHITVRSRIVSVSRNGNVTHDDEASQREFAPGSEGDGPGGRVRLDHKRQARFPDHCPEPGHLRPAGPGLRRTERILPPGRSPALQAAEHHGKFRGMGSDNRDAHEYRTDAWRADPAYSHAAAEVGNFFEWLRWYVKTDYKSIAEQVERAPKVLVDGDSSRNDLRKCLAAAAERCAMASLQH